MRIVRREEEVEWKRRREAKISQLEMLERAERIPRNAGPLHPAVTIINLVHDSISPSVFRVSPHIDQSHFPIVFTEAVVLQVLWDHVTHFVTFGRASRTVAISLTEGLQLHITCTTRLFQQAWTRPYDQIHFPLDWIVWILVFVVVFIIVDISCKPE